MAYGFQVKKPNGHIQVDSTNPCFILHDQGSKTLQSTGVDMEVEFDPIPGPVVFAAKADTTPFTMLGYKKNGDDYILSNVAKKDGETPTINYKVFVPPYRVPDNNAYGVRIYNAAGDLVFREDWELMQIVGLYSGSFYYDGQSISVEDAENNYFILTPRGVRWNNLYDNSEVYERLFKKEDSTTIRVTLEHVYTIMDWSYDDDSGWTDDFMLIEIKG